ncbi:GIY-YIG nuclease family protein [Lacicoccus alkaliphilus]|uniref:Putative endonuclease n=1 Tax=Lacicoccus alkaliphilus DSM 16010 TaxID=1123231 RepID=A0A1M7K1N3_9BACL|nr:GIY-YIG nuclease family protein [Salinicoccus alkaliphilus]SHM59114.1 putative endonuclease [Salinicoccus alkaliphilus DSM 16010]
MDKYHVYIVECKDGSLYTGYARDVASRIEKHNLGMGAKYTRNRRPVTLKYQEPFDTMSKAMKREIQIKKLTRPEKLKLIEGRTP